MTSFEPLSLSLEPLVQSPLDPRVMLNERDVDLDLDKRDDLLE